MNEQQVDQIIDMAGFLIGGNLAADPLLPDDDSILQGRYDAAVARDRMPFHVRRSVHRMLAAAYSLGARHVLERWTASEGPPVLTDYVADAVGLPHTPLTEIGELADVYDDERVNLETGEIITAADTVPCVRCNAPCPACANCGLQLRCPVCGDAARVCACPTATAQRADTQPTTADDDATMARVLLSRERREEARREQS